MLETDLVEGCHALEAEEAFRAQLFVSALGASGYAYATRTQSLPDWFVVVSSLRQCERQQDPRVCRLATCSPKRTPASKRSAAMSMSPFSTLISTLTSG